VLEQYLKSRWLNEARSMRFGETLSYRYRVELRDHRQVSELLQALSDIEGVERVVLYSEADGTGQTS
jgi:cell division protein FtsX